jgi:hypothetical protein
MHSIMYVCSMLRISALPWTPVLDLLDFSQLTHTHTTHTHTRTGVTSVPQYSTSVNSKLYVIALMSVY